MRPRFPIADKVTDTVSGKWRPFGVGIDVHKDMVWVCVLQPNYTTNEQARSLCKFATSPDGLKEMHRWLNMKVAAQHRAFLCESTGTYQFPVIWELDDWIATVFNPKLP